MTEWTLHIGLGGALAMGGAMLSLFASFALLVRWAVRIEARGVDHERRIGRMEDTLYTGPIDVGAAGGREPSRHWWRRRRNPNSDDEEN